MRVTLLPQLTDDQKDELATFLTSAFSSDDLSTSQQIYWEVYPTIYTVNGSLKAQLAGIWRVASGLIYMAQPESVGQVPVTDRFRYLMALVPLVSDRVSSEVISKAVARVILGQYKEMVSGLVQQDNTTKLAFHEDGRVAAYLEDGYYTPAGIAVTVDDSWIIAEV